MKRAILAAGPPGSGRTTFCHQRAKVVGATLIEEEELMLEVFGSIKGFQYLFRQHDEYSRAVWNRVEETLSGDNALIILDIWSGSPDSRNQIASKLKNLGAHEVILWYFATPLKQCLAWTAEKNDDWSERKRKIKLKSCEKSFLAFHTHSSVEEIEASAFDSFKIIKPHLARPLVSY